MSEEDTEDNKILVKKLPWLSESMYTNAHDIHTDMDTHITHACACMHTHSKDTLRLRGVKAWVSERLPMIFMMGGASVSIVTTDRHMILLSYYELLKIIRYE